MSFPNYQIKCASRSGSHDLDIARLGTKVAWLICEDGEDQGRQISLNLVSLYVVLSIVYVVIKRCHACLTNHVMIPAWILDSAFDFLRKNTSTYDIGENTCQVRADLGI